jgi:hypothetical protein
MCLEILSGFFFLLFPAFFGQQFSQALGESLDVLLVRLADVFQYLPDLVALLSITQVLVVSLKGFRLFVQDRDDVVGEVVDLAFATASAFATATATAPAAAV